MKFSKKKRITVSIIIVVIFIIISFILLNNKNKNNTEIKQTKTIIETQKEIEKKFDTTGYTIDNPNIIVNPYGNSPLTALVIFESKENVSPKVEIKGKDAHSSFVHTFKSNTKHYLPIYGLYAGVNNEVSLSYNDISKKINIRTDSIDKKVVLPTNIKANKTKLSNDLYFFTPASLGYTSAYDVNGDIRWYVTTQTLWKIDRLKNGNLLLSTERLINDPYYSTGMYEMNLLGKIINEYTIKDGYHHDYFEMDNGNLLVSSNKFDSTRGTVEDYIVEIDRKTGALVKEVDLQNILKKDDAKSESWSDYDWFHNNSIWYDKKTNSITLSGRHQDAIINIDYKTNKLNWIIGDSTNWSKEYKKYFFEPTNDLEWQWSQHAAMITPEGYVFAFDNGNNRAKEKDKYLPASKNYSRGVLYKIDKDNMKIEQLWQYGKERKSTFYSPYISDVDYLNKNHYLVHSGGIVYKNEKISNYPAGLVNADKLNSITTEVLNDEVIFEIQLPTNNYRVEKMKLYDNDSSLDFSTVNRLGEFNKTKSSSISYDPFLKQEMINNEYNKHNIKLKKEVDRLVVEGTFRKEQDVKIKLYKNMKVRTYDVRISTKPYTALCVDVLKKENDMKNVTINKYINSNGLKGQYSIYIEIDGKLYNTTKSISFN